MTKLNSTLLPQSREDKASSILRPSAAAAMDIEITPTEMVAHFFATPAVGVALTTLIDLIGVGIYNKAYPGTTFDVKTAAKIGAIGGAVVYAVLGALPSFFEFLKKAALENRGNYESVWAAIVIMGGATQVSQLTGYSICNSADLLGPGSDDVSRASAIAGIGGGALLGIAAVLMGVIKPIINNFRGVEQEQSTVRSRNITEPEDILGSTMLVGISGILIGVLSSVIGAGIYNAAYPHDIYDVATAAKIGAVGGAVESARVD